MSNGEKIQTIKFALFGEKGAGKTTFLTSYYGNQTSFSFEREHGYRLEAVKRSEDAELMREYHALQRGSFPVGTLRSRTYEFTFRVKKLSDPAFKIAWIDYPGGWWTNFTEDYAAERTTLMQELATAHAGVLLVDGERWLAEGVPYVARLLTTFATVVRQIRTDKGAKGQALPDHWLLAFSKADLFPESTSAESVAMEILAHADRELNELREALGLPSFGQFLLLSSVRGHGGEVTSADRFVGLELVAPVAFVAVVAQEAEKVDRSWIGRTLMQVLGLVARLLPLLKTVRNQIAPKYRAVFNIGVQILQEAAAHGETAFEKSEAMAIERRDALTDAVAAMRRELDRPQAKRAFFRVGIRSR